MYVLFSILVAYLVNENLSNSLNLQYLRNNKLKKALNLLQYVAWAAALYVIKIRSQTLKLEFLNETPEECPIQLSDKDRIQL